MWDSRSKHLSSKTHITMTGPEFHELLESTGLSRRQVAEELETSHTNLNNKCREDVEVSRLYEYAVKWLKQKREG